MDRRDAVSGIYGTLVATSVVAGLSETHALTPASATELLVTTQVTFWLADVYARYLGAKGDPGTGEPIDFVATAIREWPLLRACVPAVFAMALWWSGVLSQVGAYWLALAFGVGELAILGYVFGRRIGQRGRIAVMTATIDAGLGSVIVLAKVIAG